MKYQYLASSSGVVEDEPLGTPRTSGRLAGSLARSLSVSGLGGGWGKDVKYSLDVNHESELHGAGRDAWKQDGLTSHRSGTEARKEEASMRSVMEAGRLRTRLGDDGGREGQRVAVRSKGESRRDENPNRRLVFVRLSRIT